MDEVNKSRNAGAENPGIGRGVDAATRHRLFEHHRALSAAKKKKSADGWMKPNTSCNWVSFATKRIKAL